jgi:choline dehydrogenase
VNNNPKKSPSVATKPVTRRAFGRGLFAAGAAAAASRWLPARATDLPPSDGVFDYIVVGSGAGGGPVAARLAKQGYTVALLEAGLDPTSEQAAGIEPNTGLIYTVPALAAVSSEHPLLSWDFYVQHYRNPARQIKDPKLVPGKGILYPRGSTVGGSTAHDAMLFVYPHDDDWDAIAEATGNRSWRSQTMRKYFERLEHCDYCQPGAAGHGFDGYIHSSLFDRRIFDASPELKDLAEGNFELPSSVAKGNVLREVNHPLVAKGDTGSFVAPMHVAQKVRISIREFVASTQAEHPDKLFLLTGSLATRVLMRGRNAVGVELMQGVNLYEADKLYNPSTTPPIKRIFAKREVILSAGVYNTPQLLMLSGIGPKQHLDSLGINVLADVPGVGFNLQDRYEVTVNVALKNSIQFYSRCDPNGPPDPCFDQWAGGDGQSPPAFGPYANNALYAARIARSHQRCKLPDLFLAGQATAFHGFFPGYSKMDLGRTWTWLVLKAHTNNTGGRVKLRSTNPRQSPDINFHYFEEGTDRGNEDLDAVVQGVKLARSMTSHPRARQYVDRELFPGPNVQTDEQLREYIRNQAWGHHASCTAKIGSPRDRMAVLDGRFRVRGVDRLRVVDACAFPRIPGFFPVASVMMLGEKAADDITEDSTRLASK